MTEEEKVILRKYLPWDLPAERLEAMARAAYEEWAEFMPNPFNEVATRKTWVSATLRSYRADPIMRELYPAQFQ